MRILKLIRYKFSSQSNTKFLKLIDMEMWLNLYEENQDAKLNLF